MAMVPHPSLGHDPPHMTPFGVTRDTSDPTCLQAAVAAAQSFFADKQTPLVVLGRRTRYERPPVAAYTWHTSKIPLALHAQHTAHTTWCVYAM